MGQKYIPTGNEMVSIPEIREADGAIMSLNFLHMGFKGLVEIRGGDNQDEELFKPFWSVNGISIPIENLQWESINYWIPSFRLTFEDIVLSGIILAPVGERGFIYRLRIANQSEIPISTTTGIRGCWKKSLHTINESKTMNGTKYVYRSGWNNSFVMDFRNAVTLFSLAPIYNEEMSFEGFEHKDDEVRYLLSKDFYINPGESRELVLYWGIGIEEVGAATSAKEMMRKGYVNIKKDTCKWLSRRMRLSSNKDLEKIFNKNLFFNYFYASGITLDSEEFVLVTSRSPRYYVSAAYWDRDSLLWSFPSILITDKAYAKNMLEYVFTKQIKNVGIHSRYIDGTMLEPGFELDELCAPVLALKNYIDYSSDREFLKEIFIIKGLKRILNILLSKKHEIYDLYETFLQPTDDMIVYPYITYDNVLVWKTFTYLSEMLMDSMGEIFCRELSNKAEKVKRAILEHCIIKENGKEMFAWSIDLNGHWNIYDEPPGSLQLLTYYGFCHENYEVYKNTIAYIKRPEYAYSFHGCNIAEIGCEHAPHPWVLSISNSLICGKREDFLKLIPYLEMDNGIACESVDENTGECRTGAAFATCAGFLAYAIYHEFFDI